MRTLALYRESAALTGFNKDRTPAQLLSSPIERSPIGKVFETALALEFRKAEYLMQLRKVKADLGTAGYQNNEDL